MTRKDLEQLRALIFEIRSLNIEMLRPKPTMQTIFYKDYRHSVKGIPKSDTGYDNGEAEFDRLEQLMHHKERQRTRLVNEMELWIESVEDSEMRSILRYYYRDGLSQEKVSEKLNCSAKTIQRRLKNFWMCP